MVYQIKNKLTDGLMTVGFLLAEIVCCTRGVHFCTDRNEPKIRLKRGSMPLLRAPLLAKGILPLESLATRLLFRSVCTLGAHNFVFGAFVFHWLSTNVSDMGEDNIYHKSSRAPCPRGRPRKKASLCCTGLLFYLFFCFNYCY